MVAVGSGSTVHSCLEFKAAYGLVFVAVKIFSVGVLFCTEDGTQGLTGDRQACSSEPRPQPL